MAETMLMENDLQRHLMALDSDHDADADADADAEFEVDDEMEVQLTGETEDAFAANNQLLGGEVARRTEESQTAVEEETHDEGQNGGDQENGDESEDEDAEGEVDEEMEDQFTSARSHATGAEDGDGEEREEGHLDASGEEDEDEGNENGNINENENDIEPVGAVKIRPAGDSNDDEDISVPEDGSDASDNSDNSSEAETEINGGWDAALGDEDDEPETKVDPNRCVFCHQDESHDPSDEYEEYLACSICGDNAHQQCARDDGKLETDQDITTWRCPECIGNFSDPEPSIIMPPGGDANVALQAELLEKKNAAPRFARDLLPPSKYTAADSHSVFNNLIVDDDPMDGTRLLRNKRKTSSAEAEAEAVAPAVMRKRKKVNVSVSAGTLSQDEKGKRKDDADAIDKGTGDDEDIAKPRPSRSLRPKLTNRPRASIIKDTKKSLVVMIRLDPVELQNILSVLPRPKKKKRLDRPDASRRSRAPSSAPPKPRSNQRVPIYLPPSDVLPYYSLNPEKADVNPYGGILGPVEADTKLSFPHLADRRIINQARHKAEEQWKERTLAALTDLEVMKKPRKVAGAASQVECVDFGGHEIDTWYAAPYPEEYSRNRVLYICEFCLKYMNSDFVAWRHKMKCQAKHPPGDEIYREKSISVYEVDGRKNPVYCQNLCLLAKLFLGSKTLYYDVEPFLFYVMTEQNEQGCHFVGYFSKEKRPSSQNNVSCIMTLPIHQRKGYGNLLIDFSYLLTRVEKKSGSPEKPLSDMGLVSYRNYWRLMLCYQLRRHEGKLSITDISEKTGMTADDIVSGLDGLRALLRDPVTKTYAVRLDHEFYEKYIEKWESKKYVTLNEDALVWIPFVMGRQHASIMEHAAPLSTVAPREEDDSIAPHQIENLSLTHRSSIADIDLPGDSQSVSLAINGDEQPSTPGKGKGSDLLEASIEGTPTRRTSRKSSIPKINGFTGSKSPERMEDTDDIPPTRFEVFPPVPKSRPSRPAITRAPTSNSRPRPFGSVRKSASRRRSTGGSARRATSRPKSNSSRKRTGGTGRGPGRWPKGTKKADFGNADSGPGLPPRIASRRSRLEDHASDIENDDPIPEEEEEEDDPDAILYETPGRKRKSIASRRSIGREKGNDSETPTELDADVVMVDDSPVVGDVEADGEEE